MHPERPLRFLPTAGHVHESRAAERMLDGAEVMLSWPRRPWQHRDPHTIEDHRGGEDDGADRRHPRRIDAGYATAQTVSYRHAL